MKNIIYIIIIITSVLRSYANDIRLHLPDSLPILKSMPLNMEDILMETLNDDVSRIAVDDLFVRKFLNPFVNLLDCDITAQLSGARTYFLLGLLHAETGDFLLYSRGGYMSYEIFISDLSDARSYPKTLLIFSGPGGDNIQYAFYNYNSRLNTITVACEQYIDGDICIHENEYRLEPGFGMVKTSDYKTSVLPENDTAVIFDDDYRFNCDSLLSLHEIKPVSIQLIKDHYNPFINAGHYCYSYIIMDNNVKYYILGKIVIERNEYILYERRTDNARSIYIALFDDNTQYPQTLQIYGSYNNCLSADFEYDCTTKVITIESIEEGFGGGVIKTVETYKIADGFSLLTSNMYADFSVDERYGDLSKDYNWIEDW